MNNHPYNLVDKSPWPLTVSMGAMTFMSGKVLWFHNSSIYVMIVGLIIIIMSVTQWWRDVIRESTFQGKHTLKVKLSMKLGMILFITSEVMFFLSFFWAFFHSSLSPSIEIGMKWPPVGIKTFNPMNVPLLNTIILLCSGVTMTWSHNSILSKNLTESLKSLKLTIILGIYFSILQGYEYYESPFCMSDSIYGSLFFITTGFHGIHVINGAMFILIMTIRMKDLHFSNTHLIGYESSAWYWHFVDVVWLFLYTMIYWWGS